MPPARFEYLAPTSLEETLGILAERGTSARVWEAIREDRATP